MRGGFTVQINGDTLNVGVPDDRMDIGTGIIGQAGRNRGDCAHLRLRRDPEHHHCRCDSAAVPETSPCSTREHARDVLVALELQEIISYRMTTPEREAQVTPSGSAFVAASGAVYVELAKPDCA